MKMIDQISEYSGALRKWAASQADSRVDAMPGSDAKEAERQRKYDLACEAFAATHGPRCPPQARRPRHSARPVY